LGLKESLALKDCKGQPVKLEALVLRVRKGQPVNRALLDLREPQEPLGQLDLKGQSG
jgi:hypothetical protein